VYETVPEFAGDEKLSVPANVQRTVVTVAS